MEKFCIFMLVLIFATNSFEKAESVQLEELPLNPIDEIFGEGWWDNDKDEEWNKLTLEQNFHHQIDRQNTQIGQIEHNSIDQNPPLTESDQLGQIEHNSTNQNPPLTEADQSGIEPNSTDQLGQIEPNSTDQNPPFTESDHSDNAKNGEEITSNEKHKTVAKELGLSFTTIYKWKRKLGQSKPNKHSQSEQKKLIKRYYEIKDQNPKINDKDIAKRFKIGRTTLVRWKKQFKRQQLHSVDGHSVEVNAAANVQEIDKSNSGSI
uniref:Transposase n=1 Tax=Globodera rostochiensis TaxID=31243 RepID=A0A914HMM0_GLORO